MNLCFAAATADDIGAIFAQCKALIDAYEDIESIDYDRVLDWSRQKIARHLAEYTRVVCDGATAGYFRLHPDGGQMELDDFYILPPFRNRGIGSAVLNRCVSEARLPIYLYAFVKNQRAIALYARMGFQRVASIGTTRCILRRG